MGICDSVIFLSQAMIDSDFNVDSRQKLQLEILKLGSLYLDINNLPLWETAFQSTLTDEDDETKAGILINEIYELAMLNMYGAFDSKRTIEIAQMLIETFSENGIEVSLNQLELDQW
jgi:Fe-S oxidoreductase